MREIAVKAWAVFTMVLHWALGWPSKEGRSGADGEYSFELGRQSKVVEGEREQKFSGKGRDAVCGVCRDPLNVKRGSTGFTYCSWHVLAS